MDRTLRLLDHVLTACREGDWDECIRRVRPLVEAAPMASGPRELLAWLYLHTGNGRLALLHYEKLFTIVVGKGELFHAVAVQKRLDALRTRDMVAPGRFAAIQRWMRSHGLAFDGSVAAAGVHPLSPMAALALPHEAFDRLGETAALESFDFAPRALEAEGSTVWEVVWGRVRWSLELPNGSRTEEHEASEGDAFAIDPELAKHAIVHVVPELLTECLRFDGKVVREMQGVLASRGHRTGFGTSGITADSRALLPTRPRRSEDLDVGPAASEAPAGDAPPRLELEPIALDAGADSGEHDSGDWMEIGQISLEALDAPLQLSPPPNPGDAPRSGDAATVPPRERTIDLPTEAESNAARKGVRPVVERPGPIEMGGGLIIPPTPDPFAAPLESLGEPIERRVRTRVDVSFEGRVALLALANAPIAVLGGRLSNLSATGLALRFSRTELGARAAALDDAVLAVDLALPDGYPPLKVAGQARWLERHDALDEIRIGIEFVLLTEPDRRRIEAAVARALPAAGLPSPANRPAADAA